MAGDALHYLHQLPHGQPFGVRVKVKGGDTYKAEIERGPGGEVSVVIRDDIGGYSRVVDQMSLGTLIKGDYVLQNFDTHVIPLWTNVREVLRSGVGPATGSIIDSEARLGRFQVREAAQFKGPIPASAYRSETGGRPSQATVETTAAQITKVLGKPTAGRGSRELALIGIRTVPRGPSFSTRPARPSRCPTASQRRATPCAGRPGACRPSTQG